MPDERPPSSGKGRSAQGNAARASTKAGHTLGRSWSLSEQVSDLTDLRWKLSLLSPAVRNPQAKKASSESLWPEWFSGQRRDTPFGPVFYREEILPADAQHGNGTLASFFDVELEKLLHLCGYGQAAAAFDPFSPDRVVDGRPSGSDIFDRPESVSREEDQEARRGGVQDQNGIKPGTLFSPESVLFFDAETTGLAGGTGTYLFLVGVGFFSGTNFILRQYFLPDYHLEAPLLAAVAAEINRFPYLVSFNGKVFDWPLLTTRFQLNRLDLPLREPIHLDFLFPSRRLWKEALGSCSLNHLESTLLAVERAGDVPGSLVPSLYFDYLRQRDFALIAPIFTHNRNDVLSLVLLAARAAEQLKRPLEELTPPEALALARFYEARGDHTQALLAYERVISGIPSSVRDFSPIRQQAAQRLSFLLKTLQRHAQAAELWEAMIAAGTLSLVPYVELAKFHEHKTKNLAAAYDLTKTALEIAQRRRQLRGLWASPREIASTREIEELRHRLRRLETKLRRRSTGDFQREPPSAGGSCTKSEKTGWEERGG